MPLERPHVVEELRRANAQLAELVRLEMEFAAIRDTRTLRERVCGGARRLLKAKQAALAVELPGSRGMTYTYCGDGHDDDDGDDDSGGSEHAVSPAGLREGLLGDVVRNRHCLRQAIGAADRRAIGLPDDHPAFSTLVAAPIASPTHVYGWICLTDKTGAEEFSSADEHLLKILAAQAGRVFENGVLFRRVRGHVRRLEREVRLRERAERRLGLLYAVAQYLAATTRLEDAVPGLLALLCERMNGAAARMWSIDRGALALERIATHVRDPALAALERGARTLPLDANDALAACVCREGRAVLHTHPDAADRFHLPEPVRSALAFPVRVREDIVGVIELFATRRRRPESDWRRTLDALAGLVAQFMERREQGQQIAQLTRVYAMLSGINSAIVRVDNRKALFREACRIAVEAGRFDIAWIGQLDRPTGNVIPVAAAGVSTLEIDVLVGAADPGKPDGRGVIGEALRTRTLACSNDILRQPDVNNANYRLAAKRHARSVIALPLTVDDDVVACLSLFAREPGFFNADERRLLDELAGDISFALEYISKGEALAYAAQFDAMTGLPNRSKFMERLAFRLHEARETDIRIAVVVVDVKRFRNINETYGRHAGDQVLRALAERLKSVWPDADFLARTSSDRFAGVFPGTKDIREVARFLDSRIVPELSRPVIAGGHEIAVTCNVGVAVFPDDGANADTLYHNAEAALHKAKLSSERYLFYQRAMNASIAAGLMMESRLRHALEEDRFELHYQPKVAVADRRLDGVEALLRWRDPEAGLVGPGRFLTVLEESGAVLEVGAWALRRALKDRDAWRAAGLRAPRVAVNVSALQLERDDFVDQLRDVLARADGDAGIDIEITETMLMRDMDANIEKLAAIRDMGVRVDIDDFGTGYSSLAYLARLPVDGLKIDRAFIDGMPDSRESTSIVSTTISLAHALGLTVVAEGVQTDEQSRILGTLECDLMQGWLVGKPMRADELRQLLH